MSMQKKKGYIMDYDDYYSEDSDDIKRAKIHRARKSSIISITSVFCGIILAMIVVVGIIWRLLKK